jgi:hypothetical protein
MGVVHAQIYIGYDYRGSGGSAEFSLTGQGVFYAGDAFGPAYGIAVSGSDVFVTGGGYVTETSMDSGGVTVNGQLITDTGGPTGISIVGSDIYLANTGNGTIGEYTLGASPGTIASSSVSYISGLSAPTSIAISGSDLFVANDGTGYGNSGSISEYNISGSTPTLINQNLITGLDNPEDITISGQNLFVANQAYVSPITGAATANSGSIGEYALGTTAGTINSSASNASLVSNLANPLGVAVAGSNLYVLSGGSGSTYGGVDLYTLGSTQGTATLTTPSLVSQHTYSPLSLALGDQTPPATPTATTTYVATGTSYSNVAPVTANGGYGTTATLAGGTASSNNNVVVAFNAASYKNIASDAVTVSGMASLGTTPAGATHTDEFVLKLTFDTNAANQLGGASVQNILWFNPTTGLWVNAVDGNSDGGAGATFVLGAYNSITDDNLSYYGVDTTDGYAWAVLDHNSTFGVGNASFQPEEAPEPSAWALLLGGVVLLVIGKIRKLVTT